MFQGSQLTIIYVIVIMALLYFLMIRPQKKQMNARNEMLKQLKKGDHVSTASGINGYLRAIKENVIYIEIADGLIIEMMKASVTGIIDESLYEGTVEEIEEVSEEVISEEVESEKE